MNAKTHFEQVPVKALKKIIEASLSKKTKREDAEPARPVDPHEDKP